MIAIIDYGAGNTKSVMNALDRLNANYRLTASNQEIESAEKVILPGVGHASHAMQNLKNRGLVDTIQMLNQPVLGICIGMQLLFDYSEEGDTNLLGIVPGNITRFNTIENPIPQIGWNENSLNNDSLFKNLSTKSWFYSVHSYKSEINEFTIGTSTYGEPYSTVIKKDNFYGVQFHPEKSSKNGSILLKNFLEI